MTEIDDKALCIRCGNDEFTTKVDIGTRMVCTECEWEFAAEDLDSLILTRQYKTGTKAIEEWK